MTENGIDMRLEKIRIICFYSLLFILMNSCLLKNTQGPPKYKESIDLSGLEIYEQKLIKRVDSGRKSWLIASGKPCDNCDANLSIYLIPIVNQNHTDTLFTSYVYPGKIYDYETDSLIFESRLYIGDCFKVGQQKMVWLQKEKTNDGSWIESIYEIQFFENNFKESHIYDFEKTRFNYATNLQTEFCLEVPGIEQTSAP